MEIRDNAGTTVPYCDSATAVATSIPAVADKRIDEFVIQNLDETENLLVSLDGGTKFWTIFPCSHLAWTPKGDIEQLMIKSSSGSVDYEALINFAEC